MALPGFGPDDRPISREAARIEIDKIRSARGHVNDNDRLELSRNSAEWRAQYLSNARETREVYARFTRTISEQIYTSKFRFIYELIQNADDAVYAPNVVPTITFRVFPSELVVQSNEIGFTLSNVKAICATGQSSKVEEDDTTGEKGFGFKSVFGIADHVRVESGYWSFAFSHRADDDGIGMVTPEWHERQSAPDVVAGTSFSLRFADRGTRFINTLLRKFRELPKTVVFGLRRLRRVVVRFEDVVEQTGQIIFERDAALTADRMKITTTAQGCFGPSGSVVAIFRMFRSTATKMPTAKLRRASRSTVTIAFEVDDKETPVIPPEGQYVFAYLPVQRLPQLPFLINADFVLLASRQEIPENDWNETLRRQVAITFYNAVESICRPLKGRVDPLDNVWMRYLPRAILDGFWEDFEDSVTELLRKGNLLKSQGGVRQAVQFLRTVPEWFRHDGEPLLANTSAFLYLSSDYTSDDAGLAGRFGLRPLRPSEALAALNHDLSLGFSGVLQSTPLDDDWHTSFANFVLDELCADSTTRSQVAGLEIIPLSNGGWVSKASMRGPDSTVYLPFLIEEGSVKLQVPSGVGVKSLHRTAYNVAERCALYAQLGIQSYDPDLAVRKILAAHQSSTFRSMKMVQYCEELEILFWFWNPSSRSVFAGPPKLVAVSDTNCLRPISSLFLPSSENYHAQKLLSLTPKEDFQGFGFLNAYYMQSQVRHKISFGTDWRAWLKERGMLSAPRLAEPSNQDSLSSEMLLIARDNSSMVLATLRAHWSSYKTLSAAMKRKVSNLVLPCMNGTEVPLKASFLPTTTSIKVAEKIGMMDEVPFLKLPPEELPIESESWSFLRDFQVKCDVDIAFHIQILHILKRRPLTLTMSSKTLRACCAIYAGLAACSTMANAPALFTQLHENELVYVATGGPWRSPNQCVWNGPSSLTKVSVLSNTYGKELAEAATLFQTFLRVRNADSEDVIKELRLRSSSGNTSYPSNQMSSLYCALSEMTVTPELVETIRTYLFKEPLILVQGHWLKISDTLWNCTIAMAGQTSLESVYPNLRDFFVGKMRVGTITSDFLAHRLTKCSERANPDIDEIKRIMLGFGRLLAADPKSQIREVNVTNLRAARFLPVKSKGVLHLAKITDDFCINDHKRYGEAFAEKLDMLDFDYDDHMVLHPLVHVLGIQSHYLSVVVGSDTTVKDSSEDDDLTLHLRQRAYALSCCAFRKHSRLYFGSNTATHQLLLHAKVFICDQMWTTLTIRQHKREITVRSDRAVVKIEIATNQLELYVPSDAGGLSSCYCTELPMKLATTLGIEDEAATKIIYRILNDETADLGSIMRDEDLTACPWIENPDLGQLSISPLSGTESASIDQHTAAPGVQVSFVGSQQVSDSTYALDTSPVSVPIPLPVPAWQRAARDQQYRRLLQEVLRQANRTNSSAHGGILSLSAIDQALQDLDVEVDYSAFQNSFGNNTWSFEENARIGAAGELFVFQRLKSLGVSNFSLDNWQSRIRHHAACLVEYQGLRAWEGPEISDIMYTGDCNIIRKFLRDSTSQDCPPWLETPASPSNIQFHLEVKTTPGPCRTPFFISKNQYKLMREKAYPPDRSQESPEHVYVILRVYNLLTSKIGLDVYINPWHMRDSVLEFVADPWKVIPPDVL